MEAEQKGKMKNARQNRKIAADKIKSALMDLTKAEKASAEAMDHDTAHDVRFVLNYLDCTLRISAIKAERAGCGL